MNLFVAIIPHGLPRISEIQTVLHDRFRQENFRFLRPEKLHVTFLFLGDHSEEECRRARDVFLSLEPPRVPSSDRTLRFNRIGPFPPGRRARVLALYDAGAPPSGIHEIRRRLAIGLESFRPDTRPFRPHLTLAYPRRQTSPVAVPPVEIPPVYREICELVLLVTRDEQGGSFYEALAAFPLCHSHCA